MRKSVENPTKTEGENQLIIHQVKLKTWIDFVKNLERYGVDKNIFEEFCDFFFSNTKWMDELIKENNKIFIRNSKKNKKIKNDLYWSIRDNQFSNKDLEKKVINIVQEKIESKLRNNIFKLAVPINKYILSSHQGSAWEKEYLKNFLKNELMVKKNLFKNFILNPNLSLWKHKPVILDPEIRLKIRTEIKEKHLSWLIKAYTLTSENKVEEGSKDKVLAQEYIDLLDSWKIMSYKESFDIARKAKPTLKPDFRHFENTQSS